MLFLIGLATGTFLMILAQRRAGAIRLRIAQRFRDRQAATRPDHRRDEANSAGGDAVAGTAATVGVTFPEDLCIQVGVS